MSIDVLPIHLAAHEAQWLLDAKEIDLRRLRATAIRSQLWAELDYSYAMQDGKDLDESAMGNRVERQHRAALQWQCAFQDREALEHAEREIGYIRRLCSAHGVQ